MKIVRFDEIDSTSSHAARLVAAGEPLPFAVIAKRQTAGRGRTGKSWVSPEGGIYLSLAMDSQQFNEAQQRCLPLLVATAAALWLEQKFDLRVTIKWPNDLLFAGRKLAGILCESSFQGNSWGPAYLGIGLNWRAAPTLSDRQSTSLGEILGNEFQFDALSLAEELACAISSQITKQELSHDFPRFSLENGQLWRNQQGELVQLQGLSQAGCLRVRGLQSKVEQEISSVAHDFQWVYQDPHDFPLVLADIGNTFIKMAVFRQGRSLGDKPLCFRFKLSSPASELEAISIQLRTENLPNSWPVHCMSVDDKSRRALPELLQRLGLQLVEIPKRSIQVNFDRYKFSDLGIDRVALIEGARHALPRRNLIVISAGTCVTVEVLKGNAHYLGGYIWPGLQTKLDALHQKTSRLPQFNLFNRDPQVMAAGALLGFDTESAMLAGVLRETSLALKALRIELELAWPGATWEFLCTGGDGEVLSHMLAAPYAPQLIFEGMRLMVLGGLLEP